MMTSADRMTTGGGAGARRVYLDWNATAPLRDEARAAMIQALELTGNASSVHAEGRAARAAIEAAREQVAALLGADAETVYFTSGATEANGWVLRSGWQAVARAELEHDSVLAATDHSGAEVVTLGVERDGRVRLDDLADFSRREPDGAKGAGDTQLKRRAPAHRLIALQVANNETGILQPVAEAAELARENGVYLLLDAVQAAGRIPLDVASLDADFVSISAHKIGGPMGVGALIAPSGPPRTPLIVGGGQERRQRAGTENIAAIAGFGAAAKAARDELETTTERVACLRARLETELLAATPQAQIIGAPSPRIANTTCVALPGRLAEVMVASLDLAGIAVSAGAACSSGKVGRSRVLAAMGLAPEVAAGAIRVSLGRSTTENDIAAFLAAWQTLSASRRHAA